MDWQTLLGLALAFVGTYSLYDGISAWMRGVNLRGVPAAFFIGIPALVGGLILLGVV